MDRIHLINPILSKRVHPINITVIGAGGNGAFFLQELARMAWAYELMFENSITVTCYDGDKVDEANLGRQLFFESDIGWNKANIMISRINLTYGFDWHSVPKHWDGESLIDGNIVIGCVDKLKVRKQISESFKSKQAYYAYRSEQDRNLYYLDIGNDFDYGQVILGTVKKNESDNCNFHHLMDFVEYYDADKADEKKVDNQGNSCSAIESFSRQDLFVNRMAATLGASLLWDLIKNEIIDYHGYIFNMKEGRVNKIMI